MLGELPDRLGVMREEGRLGPEELFVPGPRRGVVADWDYREKVEAFGLN